MITKSDCQHPYPLPDGWQWVSLGTVHEIVTGSTPSRQCAEYFGGDVPFVKPPDLVQGGQLERTKEYLSDVGASLLPHVPAYSTLLCCIGSVGKSAFSLVPVRTNQQINSLIPSDAVLPKYSYYYSLSPVFQRMLREQVSITTIAIVNKSRLADIPFPLPPLAEQMLIVEQLEQDLAKLEKIEQLIREAKEIGNQLRLSILRETFAREGSSDWSSVALGDLVADYKVGLARKQADQAKKYPFGYLKMNNITSVGELDWSDFTKVQASQEEVEAFSLREGDLLFNTRNSWELVGKNAIFTNFASTPVLFNNNIMRIRFNNEIHPWFIHYYLQSPAGQEQLGQIKSATTSVAAIYARHLFQIPVPLPSYEIQERIVSEIQQAFQREREALRILNESVSLQSLRETIVGMAFHSRNPEMLTSW